MLRTALQSTRQCSQRLLTTHKDAPLLNLEHVRTTVIMEQMFPPKLARKGALPKVTQKNRVLNFVDRVHAHKTPDITCILTDFVEGVGIRGDTVTVKRRLFRGKLFPAGQAVYATDENVEKFTREKQEKGIKEEAKPLGVYGEMTVKQLAGMYLKVPMSGDNSWVLTPKNVRVALRKAGVEVKESCKEKKTQVNVGVSAHEPSRRRRMILLVCFQGVEVKESCITLPQEAITGPEEFNFRITVNGVKSVMVKGRVVLRHNDPSKDERIELPPTWLPTTKIKKTKQSAESLGDS
ncbi:large ribosomal subunit protein bL9m-like isoform X1 [Littorina saxatilis]|uniref:Large ribosomal subunit protein bL9m n=2 Tax=Littorina saxatilis TaxID=31220 RepID=A0AAN9B0L1_9CAEN